MRERRQRGSGVVKAWNAERGFGFVTRAGDEDLFVHATALPPMLTPPPQPGEVCTFEVAPGPDHRPRAVDVRFPDRNYSPPPAPTPPLLALLAVIAFAAIWVTVAIAWGRVPVWMGPLYAGVSILTAAVYAMDKAAARRRASRVAEETLLVLGALGGWPGALAAQQVLRHKTLKMSFRVRFWLSVLVNVLAFLALSTPVTDALIALLSA